MGAAELGRVRARRKTTGPAAGGRSPPTGESHVMQSRKRRSLAGHWLAVVSSSRANLTKSERNLACLDTRAIMAAYSASVTGAAEYFFRAFRQAVCGRRRNVFRDLRRVGHGRVGAQTSLRVSPVVYLYTFVHTHMDSTWPSVGRSFHTMRRLRCRPMTIPSMTMVFLWSGRWRHMGHWNASSHVMSSSFRKDWSAYLQPKTEVS